ncbi:peroxin 14 [Gracilaria domingensis]|nr:peroxin 14 [Gracilaria domingensis]
MSDPFEDPSTQMGPVRNLRESSVQQAVTFLKDPRVRSSDPSRAVAFLRQKGISDAELREAYRREGLPFPHAVAQPLPHRPLPPHMYSAASSPFPGPAAPVRVVATRPSWVSVFLGLTAAAGVYTALRELLRRYVVPLYFPDAARIAEERRLREEHTFLTQERQIAELRERIQDLLASSEKTSDQVQHLSKSISSSIALRERELSQASELRDAIRQLSHSVTASGNTDTSRFIRTSPEQDMDTNVNQRIMNHAQKDGSLAYTHINQTDISTMRKSVDIQNDDVKTSVQPGHLGVRSATGVPLAESHVDNYMSIGSGKLDSQSSHFDGADEFMTMKPAEVDENWNADIFNSKEAEKEVAQQQSFANGIHDKIESGVLTRKTDTARVQFSEEDDIGGISGVDETTGLRVAIARQLFQSDIMREAKKVGNTSQTPSELRPRPVSMPQLDTPLSDPE